MKENEEEEMKEKMKRSLLCVVGEDAVATASEVDAVPGMEETGDVLFRIRDERRVLVVDVEESDVVDIAVIRIISSPVT